MGEPLTRLSIDMVGHTLAKWLQVNEAAGAMYDAMNDEARAWIAAHGGSFEMLVPVLAAMRPEDRELARTLVLEGMDALRVVADEWDAWASLSYPRASIEGERPSDGVTGMDDEQAEARIETLERRLDRMNDKLARIIDRLEVEGSRPSEHP